MKKKLVVLLGLFLGSAPVLALAQTGGAGLTTSGNTTTACEIGNKGTLFGLLCRAGQLMNAVIPVLIALGVLYFVWGVVQYVIASDEEAKAAGKDRVIYGIIGLVVIISLWGLVSVLRNTFALDNTTNIELPTVPVVLPGSR